MQVCAGQHALEWVCAPTIPAPNKVEYVFPNLYSRTGKVRLMAKNIGLRMELLGTPKVRLGVPA